MAKVPDVFFDTISELSARLRAKEFSCVELTRAFCDRLERIGPRFNALALSLREQAIRQAKDVDSELKRGRTRGPLQGIPYGVKDLLAVKGHPTTWGAKPFAGQVFDQDAFVIDKLNKAGAILVGKLAMVELAGGGDYRFPSASLTGPGLNPWDRTRWSGGSSSGSATAEAAGLVTFALGSETSGSIVTPSAFCGVTGLRPTYGLVSRRGAMALSWTLDKIGPICRSAEDCALVLHEISGSDIEDPGSAGKSFTYSPQFARKPKDITIGYAPVDFEAWAEPDARPGLQAALEVVKGLGVQMKEVELPDFPYGAITEMIVSAEGALDLRGSDPRREGRSTRRPPARSPGSRPRWRCRQWSICGPCACERWCRPPIRTLFLDVDVLLAPSRLGAAPKITEPLDGPATGSQPASRGMSGIIPCGNLAGLPALSLPCGFAGALPVAISLVGRPFYENQLIAVGRAFQSQTDWHRRRPPVET